MEIITSGAEEGAERGMLGGGVSPGKMQSHADRALHLALVHNSICYHNATTFCIQLKVYRFIKNTVEHSSRALSLEWTA